MHNTHIFHVFYKILNDPKYNKSNIMGSNQVQVMILMIPVYRFFFGVKNNNLYVYNIKQNYMLTFIIS